MSLLAKLGAANLLKPNLPLQQLLAPRYSTGTVLLPNPGDSAMTLGAVTSSSAGLALAYPVVLTSGTNTTGTPTSQATASVTPTANRVVYAAIFNAATDGSGTTPSSVTGNGLTWVSVNTQAIGAPRMLSVFRALGASPSAGAITFDWGAEAQNSTAWIVVEVGGVDTGGANGANATVQSTKSAPAANTTMTNSLAALGSANNIHLAFVATRGSGHTVINNDADFAELADVNVLTDALVLEAQWARNQTDCTSTWGSSDLSAAISIEVKTGA